jgi:hypothetical protein
MFSEPAMIALDAGRTFNGGKPPAELSFGDISIPNPRKDSPPRTILGSRQKKCLTVAFGPISCHPSRLNVVIGLPVRIMWRVILRASWSIPTVHSSRNA